MCLASSDMSVMNVVSTVAMLCLLAITSSAAIVQFPCAVFRNASGCNGQVDCLWTGELSACATLCALSNPTIECLVGSACHTRAASSINSTECAPRCEFTESAAVCANRVSCMWNSTTGVCSQDCSGYAYIPDLPLAEIITLCNADSSCKWNTMTSMCDMSCGGHASNSSCAAHRGCYWDWNLMACFPQIYQH